MTYLSENHDRLIGELAKNAPPKFDIFNEPDTFDVHAKEHLERLACSIDDYLHRVALELESHGVSITTDDFKSLMSNALHDTDLIVTLNDHAYEMREDAEEYQLEHAGR